MVKSYDRESLGVPLTGAVARASRLLPMTFSLILGCGALLVSPQVTRAADDVTTVYSKVVSNDYVRKKLPNGSYQPEECYLGNGGRYDKPSGDASIDELSFSDIARVIAAQLGSQNYLPAKTQKTGNLLIIVRWGTTVAPDPEKTSESDLRDVKLNFNVDPAREVANQSFLTDLALQDTFREQGIAKNASLLGYHFDGSFNNHGPEISELEHERYFVVLSAFDFQEYLKHKKFKELWETRFSVRKSHANFAAALPMMAKDAADYFGKNSRGLQHVVPEGRVKVLPVKSLGEVGSPQK